MSDRFTNEITQLTRLKAVLDRDSVLPLRFDIQRLTLDHRRFKLTIRGISSLIRNPSFSSSPATANSFTLIVNVPSGYPWHQIPDIRFQEPFPFHPHIWPDGRVCWGTSNTPQPDLTLSDWLYNVIEYLQYNREALLRMNPNSPANQAALEWWKGNKQSISRYVPPIDMARLRLLIDRLRG